MRTSRIPRSAFTLIELLTVIAIIGILAAIIIPVVGKVRQSARWSQGSSNIRQVAVTMLLLAEENRGRLLTGSGFPPGGDNTYWPTPYTQFLNNIDRNTYPPRTHSTLLDPLIGTDISISGVTHYAGLDLQLPAPSRDTTFATNPSMAKFARYRNISGYTSPAQQIYFADAVLDANGRAPGNFFASNLQVWALASQSVNTANDPIEPGTGQLGEIRWTEGKAKFAFLDGHVQIMKPEEVKKRNVNPLLQ